MHSFNWKSKRILHLAFMDMKCCTATEVIIVSVSDHKPLYAMKKKSMDVRVLFEF